MAASDKIQNLLLPIGIPVAYRQFRPYKGTPVPDPPYLIYYIEREHGGGADGKNLYKKLHFVVELYTDQKKQSLEEEVEQAINEFEFEKYETYIDQEKMYLVSWEFDIYEKIRRNQS